MNRGQLHWGHIDKRRPVVIVSLTSRNKFAGDVIVVPCSKSATPMEWHVPLRRGEGGVPAACVIKCEQVMTLPKLDIEPESLGELSQERMRQIERALRSALGIELP